MTQLVNQPTSKPTNKVVAGSGGAGLGVAVSQVILWFLEWQFPELPNAEMLEGLLGIIGASAGSGMAGYFKRDRSV